MKKNSPDTKTGECPKARNAATYTITIAKITTSTMISFTSTTPFPKDAGPPTGVSRKVASTPWPIIFTATVVTRYASPRKREPTCRVALSEPQVRPRFRDEHRPPVVPGENRGNIFQISQISHLQTFRVCTVQPLRKSICRTCGTTYRPCVPCSNPMSN